MTSIFFAGDGPVFGSVNLTWTDRTTAEFRYRIEYRIGSTGAWSVLVTNQNATSALVSGLTRGRTYNFRIRAEGINGPSDWVNRSFTTP